MLDEVSGNRRHRYYGRNPTRVLDQKSCRAKTVDVILRRTFSKVLGLCILSIWRLNGLRSARNGVARLVDGAMGWEDKVAGGCDCESRQER